MGKQLMQINRTGKGEPPSITEVLLELEKS